MKQNVFSFNNQYYKQIFGTSMGNSLSPVITCLYLEFYENRLLPSIPIYTQIHSWYRYIDDVLAIIPNNFPIESFINNLNSLVPSIKFTFETPNNGKISFLDLQITQHLSLIHISEPTRLLSISYAVFCL